MSKSRADAEQAAAEQAAAEQAAAEQAAAEQAAAAAAEQATAEQAAAAAAEQATAAPKSTITVTVPKAFNLLSQSGAMKSFSAGIQEMDPEDASHWYAEANGVKPYAPD